MTRVFVAMPFTDEFWQVWETIDRAARKADTRAVRVDQLPQVVNIHDAIWREIEACTALVADLTGQNANVAMEVHHARLHRKPLVLITQNASDLPFDLRVLRAIVYQKTEAGLEILEQRIADSLRGAISVSSQPEIIQAGMSAVQEVLTTGTQAAKSVIEDLAATLPSRGKHEHILNHVRQELARRTTDLHLPAEVSIPHHIEADGEGGKVLVLEIRVRDRLNALINVWESAPYGGPRDTLRLILWLTPEHLLVPWPEQRIRQVAAEETDWSPVFAPPSDCGPGEFDIEWFEGEGVGVLRIESVSLADEEAVSRATGVLAELLRGGAALAVRLAEPCRAAERALEGLRAAGDELRERPVFEDQNVVPKSDLGRWNNWYYLQLEDVTGTAFWVALDAVGKRLVFGMDPERLDHARQISRGIGATTADIRGYPGGSLLESDTFERASAGDVREMTLRAFRCFADLVVHRRDGHQG